MSDGPQTGPVGEDVRRTGTPPVPRPPAGEPPAGERPAGERPAGEPQAAEHRTEPVPFPLPPLRSGSPPPPGVETGRLSLGGYPPKVPGTATPGPAADRSKAQAGEDGAAGGR